MKIYEGVRTGEGCHVTVNGAVLPGRHDLRNHSPSGFEWSYGGSGPAQLALALVADVLEDDDLALHVYQQFKWKVVALLDQQQWRLTEAEVRARVGAILAQRPQCADDR